MSSGLYSHTTRGVGTVLTAAIYNADHVNHITNANPSQIGGYSDSVAEMQNSVNPGDLGSESLSSNLADEIARLRFVLARITGETHWYEPPVTSLATIGGGNPLSLAFAETPLTLRRTENDVTPREIESIQSGSGVGDKYSKRLVGTASNAVAEIRELIGAVEMLRRTTTLITHQLNTHVNGFMGVGAAGVDLIKLFAEGYVDIKVLATPANPAANHLRLYIKDDGGDLRLATLDTSGAEVLLAPVVVPQLIWEQFADVSASGATEDLVFTADKYSKIIVIGSDITPSGFSALQVDLRTSGTSMVLLTGPTGSALSHTFEAEFAIGLVAATKRHAGRLSGTEGASIIDPPVQNGGSNATSPDRVQVRFSSGTIASGRLMAYGLLATDPS
jgi:hypothetical protein